MDAGSGFRFPRERGAVAQPVLLSIVFHFHPYCCDQKPHPEVAECMKGFVWLSIPSSASHCGYSKAGVEAAVRWQSHLQAGAPGKNAPMLPARLLLLTAFSSLI